VFGATVIASAAKQSFLLRKPTFAMREGKIAALRSQGKTILADLY
jgi:hypothetical protein